MLRNLLSAVSLAALLAVNVQSAELQWEEVTDVRIPVPPAEHPRLYLRAEHVEQLGQRLKEPALQPALGTTALRSRRETSGQENVC